MSVDVSGDLVKDFRQAHLRRPMESLTGASGIEHHPGDVEGTGGGVAPHVMLAEAIVAPGSELRAATWRYRGLRQYERCRPA